MKIKNLESVGCAIDLETGITYPLKVNGEPDFYDGVAVHLDDVCEEWDAALSDADRAVILGVA